MKLRKLRARALAPVMLVCVCLPLGAQQQQRTPASNEPVPQVVRETESTIEREFKKYGAGVRGGVALDPELVDVGVHATLGPFFKQGIAFRPNFEFGFGELTTLFAINLEAVYFLPYDRDHGDTKRFYFGAGPGFNFADRGLEAQQGGEGRDFSDFDFDVSLNLLGGVEWQSGTFVELKAAAYGGPTIRLLFGYTF